MSLHPDEQDAVTLWAEIHRLRCAAQGPDGFATWQDAATSERIRRVQADAELARLRAECERLRAEAAKSERRAIAFGDIVQGHVIAMRAAVVAAKLEGLDVGMQWIANTLCGPGHLPDLGEARALGGAQALWDKETAEHEAFRAAHPGPGDAP